MNKSHLFLAECDLGYWANSMYPTVNPINHIRYNDGPLCHPTMYENRKRLLFHMTSINVNIADIGCEECEYIYVAILESSVRDFTKLPKLRLGI